ncbi:MAG: acetyl-CoA synthase subunit delta, partial [Nitrososphaeria archaeon]|nr:acetyl-CoA synthase subunit delta [Nitrososphaeria archaeon]
VLQAVDVPLVIGGSGTPEKDPLVLEKCAEAAEGERCLLASANLDLDYKKIAKAAIKYKHNVLSWTSMNINDQKSLNKLLFDEGLPKEQIIQ